MLTEVRECFNPCPTLPESSQTFAPSYLKTIPVSLIWIWHSPLFHTSLGICFSTSSLLLVRHSKEENTTVATVPIHPQRVSASPKLPTSGLQSDTVFVTSREWLPCQLWAFLIVMNFWCFSVWPIDLHTSPLNLSKHSLFRS